MGTYFSKEKIDKTPEKKLTPISNSTFEVDVNDPRSPSLIINRTPINENNASAEPTRQLITRNIDLTAEFETPERSAPSDNILKTKLLRNLGYNLIDPRSPSMFINRTPLNLREEKTNVFNTTEDLNQNLNITNGDISNPSVEFVEIAESYNELDSFESALSTICDELTQSFGETEISTDKYLETNFDYNEEQPKEEEETNKMQDPRSPSIGIERTPMVPKESYEKSEEACVNFIDDEINNMVNEVIYEMKKLTNAHRKPSKETDKEISNIPKIGKKQKFVYEDIENIKLSSTPKKLITNNSNNNRTPLGCVVNKTHFRSKSTESNQKSKNSLVKITGFSDDSTIVASKFFHENLNDENTPTQREEINFGVLTKSRSRIPLPHRIIQNN